MQKRTLSVVLCLSLLPSLALAQSTEEEVIKAFLKKETVKLNPKSEAGKTALAKLKK